MDYDPRPVDLRGPRSELRKASPAGRVPTLVVGDFVLTETPAILHWLAGLAPEAELLPRDARGAAQALSIMSWMASHLHILRRRQLLPQLFAHGKEAQRDVAAIVRPLYLAGLEELDRLALTGALEPPALQAYALVFYNWSLIDKVPAPHVTNLAALALQFSTVTGVAHALRLHGSPILQAA